MMSLLLLVLCLWCFAQADHSVAFWHGYNSSALKYLNHSAFRSLTEPFSESLTKKLSLWSTVRTEFDIKHGSTLFGSASALEAIHAHQNPSDCSKAKFIISGGWPYGFGSRIHMEGVVLSYAIELGRVYLPHPDGDNIMWETNIPFCSRNRTSREVTMQCFYLPPSRCTIKDALLSGAVDDVNKLKTLRFQDFEDGIPSSLPDTFNLLIEAFARGKELKMQRFVPSMFNSLLYNSPLRSDAHHYWWRAVSASYLLRPNELTLAELQRLSSEQQPPLTISDPRSCVALMVRHGDKGQEMKLVQWEAYRDTAVRMWQEGLVPGSRHHGSMHSRPTTAASTSASGAGFNATMFITTEDEEVLQKAVNWSHAGQPWTVAFTNLFDRTQQVAAKSYEQLILVKNANKLHHDLEYLSMLLNLQYSLQCEAWVCTLASNSCRIIDELRCTIGAKCNRHYADLSVESCSAPPCMAGSGGHIVSFGT